MKAIRTTASPVYENWSNNKHKLKDLFTWLTGYDIMQDGSREDLVSEKVLRISKNKKIIHSI